MQTDRLHEADGERLRDLRLRALADAPDAFESTHDETAARPVESWVQQLRDLPTFVVREGDRDLGMARGAIDPERPATGWLLSMWVDPAARGKGAGERLVDAVVGWARGAGLKRILLDVGDENAPAIALYARKGFEPTGDTSTLSPPREHIREHRRALDLG